MLVLVLSASIIVVVSVLLGRWLRRRQVGYPQVLVWDVERQRWVGKEKY